MSFRRRRPRCRRPRSLGPQMRHFLWMHPWDLLDQDPHMLLDEFQSMGLDEVRLALAYHSTRVVLPRNRRHLVYDYVQSDGIPHNRKSARSWSPLLVVSSTFALGSFFAITISSVVSVPIFVSGIFMGTFTHTHYARHSPKFRSASLKLWGRTRSYRASPASTSKRSASWGTITTRFTTNGPLTLSPVGMPATAVSASVSIAAR